MFLNPLLDKLHILLDERWVNSMGVDTVFKKLLPGIVDTCSSEALFCVIAHVTNVLKGANLRS